MANGRLDGDGEKMRRILAQQVRNHRHALGLRQSDLAVRVGYTQSAISRIERGEILPSMAKLLALAVALGVTPALLLWDEHRLGGHLMGVACLFAVL